MQALSLLPIGFIRRGDKTASSASALTGPAANPAATHTDYLTAINPTLANGNFAQGTGQWETTGNVTPSTQSTQITLGESTRQQAHLAQAFVITPQDRFLTFTVSGLNLQSNSAESGDVFSPAPQDAFEVALQDANTGQSLTGSGLAGSHSDALLNVQLASSGNSGNPGSATTFNRSATGFNAPALQHRAASALRHTDNADGSRTYVLDLSGLLGSGTSSNGTSSSGAGNVSSGQTSSPTSRSVNLSFDLIGFGQNQAQLGSQVRISDVRLFSAPVAVDVSVTIQEMALPLLT